jgi:hypothetical protein
MASRPMRDGSFGGAGSNNQRLLFQDGKNLSRSDPPNAMALQEFLDLCLTQPGRLGWGGRRLPPLLQRSNRCWKKWFVYIKEPFAGSS